MTARSSPSPWLPRTRRQSALAGSHRLFCLPSAGTGASMYYRWKAFLSGDVDLMPVQLPGREERYREPPFHDMDQLTDALSAAILPYLDVSFALFGHSMGALVAYELIRKLARAGTSPTHLFVSSMVAPQLIPTAPPIRDLPDASLIDTVENRYGQFDRAISGNKEYMKLLLPVLRADLTSVETYCFDHDTPLDCPIIALGGDRDETVTPAQLDAWRVHTARPFTRRLFRGEHFYLREHAEDVCQTIQQHLRTA